MNKVSDGARSNILGWVGVANISMKGVLMTLPRRAPMIFPIHMDEPVSSRFMEFSQIMRASLVCRQSWECVANMRLGCSREVQTSHQNKYSLINP